MSDVTVRWGKHDEPKPQPNPGDDASGGPPPPPPDRGKHGKQ